MLYKDVQRERESERHKEGGGEENTNAAFLPVKSNHSWRKIPLWERDAWSTREGSTRPEGMIIPLTV